MSCDWKSQKGLVLVADGDNHLRKQLSAILRGMGYDVVVSVYPRLLP
jgi:CheY-like chemotaxis protein